jgi:hypothetical protein
MIPPEEIKKEIRMAEGNFIFWIGIAMSVMLIIGFIAGKLS